MKLSSKLSLVLIVAVLIAGILISIFFIGATQSLFDQYIFKVREAQLDQWEGIYTEYYLFQGSWQGVGNLRIIGGPMSGGKGFMGGAQGPGESLMNRQSVILTDKEGKILHHPYSVQLGANLESSILNKGRPIKINGNIIGYLFPQELFIPAARELEQKFLSSVFFAVAMGSLLASLVAILFGLWWSRKLTQPLVALVNASEEVAKGRFSHNLPLTTKDELGSVSQAFNKMAQELNQSQKIRQQMFADISHELRTPLTILGSKLESVLEGEGKLDASDLSALYDEVIRLQGLVKELQDLSNLEAGQTNLKLQDIDPRQFTKSLSMLLEAEAKARGIALEIQVEKELVILRADPQKLKQIVLNLLSNAFHYTQPGGLVQLKIGKKGERALIEIMDTGSGIAPEDLAHIFHRFYRADQSRTRATGGTGLGLAIAKGYVEAQGGDIFVESTLGVGTKFTITLPL